MVHTSDRFRLQYRTGNKEVDDDLSGLLDMCIPNWVKFCLFSKTKSLPSNIHSKSQWMSMTNLVAVLKSLIPGLFGRVTQLTENAENAF
jgi:adenine-specific DNA methylase